MQKHIFVGHSGPCEARDMQKHIICWPFRALRGPGYAETYYFLAIPGLARPGICRNILFFGHSGPGKARNMQKHTIFWPFRALQGPEYAETYYFLAIPGLARPGTCRNILFFGHSGPCKARNMQKHTIFWPFRALQGPKYAETYYFLGIPGLA